MSTKRITTNQTAYVVIIILAVIVGFLLLGGGPWVKGLMNESGSVNMAKWNWTQILIGVGVGFLLGLAIGSRKR